MVFVDNQSLKTNILPAFHYWYYNHIGSIAVVASRREKGSFMKYDEATHDVAHDDTIGSIISVTTLKMHDSRLVLLFYSDGS